MRTACILAFIGAMAVTTAGHAATVTFEGNAANKGYITVEGTGLTFTTAGSDMYVWDAGSLNSNGTNNLIFSDGGSSDTVTITRTGGGLFNLLGFDLATSWYSDVSPNGITINGNPLEITNALTTYSVNLLNVTSVVFSGLDDDFGVFGDEGYWTLDNVEYTVAAVPIPATMSLMLLAFGGLGLLALRRRI